MVNVGRRHPGTAGVFVSRLVGRGKTRGMREIEREWVIAGQVKPPAKVLCAPGGRVVTRAGS